MKNVFKHKHGDTWYSANGHRAYLRGERPMSQLPAGTTLDDVSFTGDHHIGRDVGSGRFKRWLVPFFAPMKPNA